MTKEYKYIFLCVACESNNDDVYEWKWMLRVVGEFFVRKWTLKYVKNEWGRYDGTFLRDWNFLSSFECEEFGESVFEVLHASLLKKI